MPQPITVAALEMVEVGGVEPIFLSHVLSRVTICQWVTTRAATDLSQFATFLLRNLLVHVEAGLHQSARK